MDGICRLCCSTKFVNNNIFDEENALFIKMSLYLPIKLQKGDRLPQRICDRCSCKVNDFYQFCNEAIEVQNKFNAIFLYDKEAETSIDLTLIKRDINTHLLKCDKSTQTSEQNTNLRDIEIKEEPKPTVPSLVKEELTDDDYMPVLPSDSEDEVLSKIQSSKRPTSPNAKEHGNGIVKNHRKRNRKSKDDWKRVLPVKLLTENDVNVLQGDDQGSLNVVKHEAIEVRPQDLGVDIDSLVENSHGAYYCCICFIQTETRADMLKHYKSHVIHAELQAKPPPTPPLPAEEPFRCQRCRKTVMTASQWAAHWRRHWVHDRRPYRCGLCDKTFRDHKQIFKHGKTHKAGEERKNQLTRFLCDSCPEGYQYLRCLLAHRTRAHPETAARPPVLRCGVCKRSFAHLNSLRRHQRAHTGERNHLCNVCGKALSSREHLKFHIRIHTGYKPNICGVCGKGFVKKCNLTMHERVHSGEKPYVCSHCGKAFSQRSTLVIHERYHNGARPYECELCGRGFVARGLLTVHLKTACTDHPPPIDKLSSRT